MNIERILLICFCFLLGNGGYANEEIQSPETLVSRARMLEEPWTGDTPPSLMEADLEVPRPRGAPSHGSYTLHWMSPLQWREEIRFADYDRVRVRDAKGYWQTSKSNYQPEIIFQLDTLLRPKELLKIEPKQGLGKVRSRGKDQQREMCTEVKWSKATDHVLCFDQTTGALLSVEYPQGENQHLPEISRIEYGAFHAVGTKLFPYEIKALQGKNVVASVRVSQITGTEHDPALFKAPVNAEFWEDCDDRQDAELADRTHPMYPEGARSNHEQGRVIFYGVIETDGSVSHLAIIHRASPSIEAAALETVRRWRYKPATCEQRPIRKEISIDVDFWLQY
jgi:TonB family protein